jgi:dienelactone hydrolase
VENLLGAYGEWAAGLAPDPARLSFRGPGWADLDAWREAARGRLGQALLSPDTGPLVAPTTLRRGEQDGLATELLSWPLPYGPPTEALLLKPTGARGPLPAVLALHDHSGNKAFGWRKIARLDGAPDPLLRQHQEHYYGGLAWANELARRGYVVLVPDAFLFGSRRVRAGDLPAALNPDGIGDDLATEADVAAFNRLAAAHEAVVMKSLLCAGTTVAGVAGAEDRRALDQLLARPEVDSARVACCGLSGGGLRSVLLAGLDERIAAAACIGMMTTWRDFLLNRAHRHTWMCYMPGLPLDLDYPEILALAAPKPTLVQSNSEDAIFTLAEMRRAAGMIGEIYGKAGVPDRHRTTFYPGPHKFDRAMQAEAFAWLDQWLKP